ncbi:uncharacterized protein TNCV_1748711 [Trichonephila clavipes]|nr:uncharacterized protein TNCV_1748711 [Trichonephila clavipes]
MAEEKLLGHIISRLEPQLLDYVEVRHPQTTSSLLQLIDKYEERNRQKYWRDSRVKTLYHDTCRPKRESNRFGGQGVGDSRRFESRRRSGQSDHGFNNHGGRQGGSRNGAFRGQNGQDRKTPSDLPCVLILLNETFVTLCGTQEQRNNLYPKRSIADTFHIDHVKGQSSDGPRACCHLGRVELQIWIRDFQKTWEFHILDNMQYQCLLGINFMKDSRLTLDFDKKSLVIPDDQIKPLPIVEKPVEIDLSNKRLGERNLQDFLNRFKGLFSDKPGLTRIMKSILGPDPIDMIESSRG